MPDLLPQPSSLTSQLLRTTPITLAVGTKSPQSRSVAGLSSSSTFRFSSQTQLITDVTLTHPYIRSHEYKPNYLWDAEALKNRLYFSSYQAQGMAFAPLACNSFGQQAPEMLRYQWIVAGLSAQRVVTLPYFSLPAAAVLAGVVDEHASLLKLYH